MTRPNERALMLAHRLEHVIAANITAGLEQLQQERVRALIDGPDRGATNGRGSSTAKPTERDANEAYRIRLLIEDLRDAMDGAKIAVDLLDRLAADARRTRAFAPPPRFDEVVDKVSDIPTCGEGQRRQDGVEDWGDPGDQRRLGRHNENCPPDCDDSHACGLPATKDGLCLRHYMARYRWREKNGKPVAHYFAPGVEV